MRELKSKIHYSFLFKLLLLFIFFLPLRSLEIPIEVVGFAINIPRIVSVLMVLLIGMNVCLDARYLRTLFRSGHFRNKYVLLLLLYFIFSIVYYYILVYGGYTARWGEEGSFIQSWRGRPFVQLVSFLTYGIVPFYLVAYYASRAQLKRAIENVIIGSILILLYYGFLQQIMFAVGLPVTSRNIFDTVHVISLTPHILRFYSLGGEPRDFGTFILGGLLFYSYVRYGQFTWKTKFNITLMIVAFLFTASSSSFLAAVVASVLMVADALYRRRARIKVRYFKYALAVALITVLIFRTTIVNIIGSRTAQVYEAITTQLKTSVTQPGALTQFVDIVGLYYVLNIASIPFHFVIFGSGYSNFVSPVADLVQKNFGIDLLQETGVVNPNLYFNKLFIETGLIGVLIFGMMFVRTLKLNGMLLRFFGREKQRVEYIRALLLRLSFIAFFVGGVVQFSFYYFIIIGLMIGWLNEVYLSYADRNNQSNRRRNERGVSGVPS